MRANRVNSSSPKIPYTSSMKRIKKKYQSLLLAILAAILILPLTSGEQKFRYEFVKESPWKYEGVLTAPYDFPILKSPEALAKEKEEVKQSILPYYDLREDKGQEVLKKWDEEFQTRHASEISSDYDHYVENFLRSVYVDHGVINQEEKEQLKEQGREEINLLEGNVHRAYPIALLFSIGDAYNALISNTPDELDASVVKEIFRPEDLVPNVIPNPEKTKQVVEVELKNIPNNTGLVQKDERIIGQGETVTEEAFNKLTSFKQAYESKKGLGSTVIWRKLGLFLITLTLFVSIWLFWAYYRPTFLLDIRNSIFILGCMLLFILLTQLVTRIYPSAIYAVPYAILPIIIRPFFHSRMAFFVHLITIIISSFFVSEVLEFILIQVIAGLVALYSLQTLNSRGQLVRTAFFIFISYIFVSLSLALALKGTLFAEDFNKMLYFAFNLIFLMFSYMLIYPIEKAFNYVSNVSLVELSDINRPLLRQLSEEAPGTFQHSMQVSILASEAAAKIGAHVQLVRTGALYHDIGKMLNPSYFTENQGQMGNPHSGLSYKESAATIIKHVTDGYTIAQKHRLPKAIVNMILTHHGTGKVKYFYRLYCKEHPEENVDPAPFTYPGPNPSSREEGILMLADCVEASSRSLKAYNETTISNLVEQIIDSILDEGLLKNTPLTFRNISEIKEVFIDKLKTIYHSRISYPKESKQEKEVKEKNFFPESDTIRLDDSESPGA